MDLAISDGGDGGQHHVEAVEPRPAFDEMEARDADEDQCQQREEEDLQIEQGLHSSHCVALRRAVQQKRPSHIGDGRWRTRVSTQVREFAWLLKIRTTTFNILGSQKAYGSVGV